MPARPDVFTRSSAAWMLVAASGLVLALGGSLAPLSGTAGEGAGGVALHLSRTLTGVVLAGFAVTAVLLFGLLVPRGLRRKKKKGDEEFELYYEPPRVSPWAVLAIALLLLLPLAAIGYLVWSGWPAPIGARFVRPPRMGSPLPGGRPVGPPSGGVTTLPLFNMLFTITACLAALAAAGVMVWLYLGDRIAWWWVGSPFDGARPLRHAVDESLDELHDDPDPRRAIIGCYRRFERALAASHVPRAPWQTALEFMREALARAPLPEAAVERLTALFEVARFSQHPVGAPERDAAARALVEIKASLEGEGAGAHSA